MNSKELTFPILFSCSILSQFPNVFFSKIVFLLSIYPFLFSFPFLFMLLFFPLFILVYFFLFILNPVFMY